MRKNDVTEKIDPLTDLADLHLIWMKIKQQHLKEEITDSFHDILKKTLIRMHDDKIVTIAQIMPCFQLMLRELIQLIEIDIGEQLARHIA